MGLDRKTVLRESGAFGFVFEVISGFPGDFIMFVGKTGLDSEKNVAMVPIKLLPNRT